MSRTKKEGKRGFRHPAAGKDRAIQEAVIKRHTFGSTEKILRRNRKTWVRLGNKRRRQLDKNAVKDDLS